MKKLIVLTLAFILLVCMTVSCDSENETNEINASNEPNETNASGTTVGDGETPEKCSQHTSGEWIVEKEANCKEEGTKRKECSVCGEILETEVIPVNANVHNYVNYECSLCGYKYESQGLEFESNGDGTCSVKGIGTCQDTVLIIPSKSTDGDTVVSVARGAFANCINLTGSITFPKRLANSYDPDTGIKIYSAIGKKKAFKNNCKIMCAMRKRFQIKK